MGNWAEYIKVDYDGTPLLVHLRTGYERAVLFPEPIELHSINDQPVNTTTSNQLPNTKIEIDDNVLGFSPLQQFKQHKVIVRGIQTGILYNFQIRSSSTGKRQPIQIGG